MESLKPEQATQIAAAREAYFRHGQFAAEHLRSSVWRSWNRCQAAGHEPKFRLEPAEIGRRRIHEVEERSRSLIVGGAGGTGSHGQRRPWIRARGDAR